MGKLSVKAGLAGLVLIPVLAGSLSACSVQPKITTNAEQGKNNVVIVEEAKAEVLLSSIQTERGEVIIEDIPLEEPVEDFGLFVPNNIKDNFALQMINGDNVNVRYNANQASFSLGKLNKGTGCYSILTYEDWTLIRIGKNIGWVHNSLLTPIESYNGNYIHTENNDIVYTTSRIYFRSLPEVDKSTELRLIDKNQEIRVFARTNNNWLLGQYDGQIGYVYAENTKSLKEKIQEIYPEIADLKVQEIVSMTRDTNLLYNPNPQSKVVKRIKMYQSAEVIDDCDGFYFVKTNEGYGYIAKKDTQKLTDTCVVADVSDQEIKVFIHGDIVLVALMSSGKPSTPSPIGVFKISKQKNGRYLTSDQPDDEYKVFTIFKIEQWVSLKVMAALVLKKK